MVTVCHVTMLLTTDRGTPQPPHRNVCLGTLGAVLAGLSTFSLALRNFPNFHFSKNTPKNFQDNYSVTINVNHKSLDFAKGDLVYFVGYEGK